MIQRANLDGSNVAELVGQLNFVEGVAMNAECGRLFWSGIGTETIQGPNLDGSVIFDIAYGSESSRVSLAVDGPNEDIYWADTDNGLIQKANFDGTGQSEVVIALNRPCGIALNMVNGHIYWADRNAKKLQRADLDGTNVNVTDIVPSGLSGPFDMAVDVGGGKIYWSDVTIAITPIGSIKCANLNGSDVETIVTGLETVTGLAVDRTNGLVVWTDSDNGVIQKSALDGSNVTDVLTGLSNPHGIAIDALPLCVVKPFLDGNGNCKTNMIDFALLVGEWLDCGMYPLSSCNDLDGKNSGVIIGSILGDAFDAQGISEALAGQAGIPLTLKQDGETIDSTVTDFLGAYNFNTLREGVYQVQATIPDQRSATTNVDVATNLTSRLDFLIVESKGEGIFPSYAGVAIDINTMPAPDLDGDAMIGLGDLQQIRREDFTVDPEVVELIENNFGRAVAYLPGEYEAQVTDGGTVFSVGNGLASGRSLSGYTRGTVTMTEVPKIIRFEVVEDRGTVNLEGLGDFDFTENPDMLTYLHVDLNTNRVTMGDLHLILDGGQFELPVEIDAEIPDGYIVGAANDFSLYHFVGIRGTLSALFLCGFGTMVFAAAKCDPPKADNVCQETVVNVGDARCDYGGTACKTEGSVCASNGRCGICTTKKKI